MLLFTVTAFLLLIGRKARESGCDWFIQLSDNRCPINDPVRLTKNRVLTAPYLAIFEQGGSAAIFSLVTGGQR